MAVLQKNDAKLPFWGKRQSLVRGLDPLGLQNASVATYTLLLPGLNNVTGRIRYYGFYCWLLDEYAQKVGVANKDEQYRFIRRAELAVAILAQYQNPVPGAIPGNLYVANLLRQHKGDSYDLKTGADKQNGSTDGTYWKYGAGAFGQYYVGALRDIGLIMERELSSGVYVRTSVSETGRVTGLLLAKAFADNIPEEVKSIFLNSVLSGSMQVEGQKLQVVSNYFNLGYIPEGSEEEQLYWQLLIDSDRPKHGEGTPSFYRRETISHLLDFHVESAASASVHRFTHHAYAVQGIVGNKSDDCLTGWYYYQLNEYWQYSCLAILNSTLAYLEQKHGVHWAHLSNFLTDISRGIVAELKSLGYALGSEVSLEEVLAMLDDAKTEENLIEDINNNKQEKRAAYSFILIWKLLLNNHNNLTRLEGYARERGIERDGDGVHYLLQLEHQLHVPLEKFVTRFLYVNIIQRHQLVAFRKMGSGYQSTQKFILEDGYIRLIGHYDPGFTGPRVGTLIGFMRDLHILDEEGNITETGQEKYMALDSNV